MYEMLVGIPPFYSKDRQKMFGQIVRNELTFPDPSKSRGLKLSDDTKDIITKMLQKDKDKRIGA